MEKAAEGVQKSFPQSKLKPRVLFSADPFHSVGSQLTGRTGFANWQQKVSVLFRHGTRLALEATAIHAESPQLSSLGN